MAAAVTAAAAAAAVVVVVMVVGGVGMGGGDGRRKTMAALLDQVLDMFDDDLIVGVGEQEEVDALDAVESKETEVRHIGRL